MGDNCHPFFINMLNNTNNIMIKKFNEYIRENANTYEDYAFSDDFLKLVNNKLDLVRRNHTGKYKDAFLIGAPDIGKIGEDLFKHFIKNIVNSGVLPNVTKVTGDDVNHDDFDIMLTVKTQQTDNISGYDEKDIKIELKTAKIDGHGCFQFNGLKPDYLSHYILLFGIDDNKLYYRFFNTKKSEKQSQKREGGYKSKKATYERIYWIDIYDGDDIIKYKQLTPMTPGGNSYKYMLQKKDLLELTEQKFIEDLKALEWYERTEGDISEVDIETRSRKKWE